MKKPLLLTILILALPSFGKEIVIAVNKTSPRTSISMREIKSIFTGEQSEWEDGEEILVIDYKRDTQIKKTFCKKVLKISQVQLYKKWIRASLLGKSSQVVLVGEQDEVVKHLIKNPTSVGYLEKDALKNSKLKRLKVTK
ncbi:MAG: hypothetical protein NXH75_07200 [Halobacteriovoraceae bacterium]|nr:hypothetical protein [Halobacteriovoraceae bacterium]